MVIKEYQTVFRFPSELRRLRILRMIHDDFLDGVYRDLVGYYKTPRVQWVVDPDLIYNYHKNDFPNVMAMYIPGKAQIVFKTERIARQEETVIHEFYHHLEHTFGINGEGHGTSQTAHSFASLFFRFVGENSLYYLSRSEWDSEAEEMLGALHVVREAYNMMGRDEAYELIKKIKRGNYRVSHFIRLDSRLNKEYSLNREGIAFYEMARRVLKVELPESPLVWIEEMRK